MPKVFIPSVPTRWDEATRGRVPSIDLNPAAQYGELHTLSDGQGPFEDQLESVRLTAGEAIDKDDYILCVGDVVLTAAAIAIANAMNGVVNLLRWDREAKHYNVVTVEL